MFLKHFSAVFFLSIALGLWGCGDQADVGNQVNEQIQASKALAAQEGVQAGVWISPEDGKSIGLLRTLKADEVTAFDVLLGSGEAVETFDYDFGPAICAINGVGMPAENCFNDPELRYWALFIKELGGDWKVADFGADQVFVKDGDLYAFIWTASDEEFNAVRTPPDIYLADLERE